MTGVLQLVYIEELGMDVMFRESAVDQTRRAKYKTFVLRYFIFYLLMTIPENVM